MNLFDLPRPEEEAVTLLQENSILPTERFCPNNHNMKLYFSQEIFWKCNVKVCKKKVNIRTSTWFMYSRLSFVTAVRFFYGWSKEYTSIKWCMEELGTGQNTIR